MKLESLNREEEAESVKLESLNRDKVYLDLRDLKSEELNLKWVLGRRDIGNFFFFNKILEDVGNIKIVRTYVIHLLGTYVTILCH